MSISEILAATVFIKALNDTIDMAIKKGIESNLFKHRVDGVKKIQHLVSLLATLPSMILHLIWSIIGIILYHRVHDLCAETGKAEMALAWCILTLVYVLSSAYQIAKQQDLDLLFYRLSLSHRQHYVSQSYSQPDDDEEDDMNIKLDQDTVYSPVSHWKGS